MYTKLSPPLHPFIIPTQKKYPHPPPIEEKVGGG